jgi:hypothetical protein
MKQNIRMILISILSITILSSLFLIGVYSFDKVYAQQLNVNTITLPLPTACVFDDGDLPKVDPDDCTPIGNNEETLGSDNILFTLDSSPELFEIFMCTLKDQNGVLVSSGECGQSNNIAEAEYNDLADGTYTFTVTASRTIPDNNDNNEDITETAVSPEFNFVVGIGSGGSDFNDVGEDALAAGTKGTTPGATLDNKDSLNGGFARLNPIWRSCDVSKIGTEVVKNVQNSLSGMKYTAKGVVSFQDFSQQLRKFNTDNFVLEIYVNFLSGGIVAELYPTIQDINKIRTQSDLYKLDPFLVTSQQAPKDGTNSPNRVPFEIESVDTECVYEAPKIATSFNIGGSNTHTSQDVFAASNSPFQTCTTPESEAATYAITFSIRDKDRKNLLEGHQNVQFTIFQQISGNNPNYYGFLIFNPLQSDEQRLNLMLNGNNIVTNCRTSLLY